MRLLDYAKNVYSQNGEDGVIEKLLESLPVTDKWCVDIGAWDGQYLSNTCTLIEKFDYAAVLVEANTKRFADLVKRHGSNPKVIALSVFVGFTPADDLDSILKKTPIPKDFDFLTISIEGNDYHVWKTLSSFTPKIVCVHCNPTIPTEVEFVQPADMKVRQGSSFAAFTRLGHEKGYELVCLTHNRAFFVQSQYFPALGILDNSPQALREDFSTVTYIFCGFDGTIFVTGREVLPHHWGIRIEKRLRQLPKYFRSYARDFSPFKTFMFKVYKRGARILGRA